MLVYSLLGLSVWLAETLIVNCNPHVGDVEVGVGACLS